MPSKLPKGLTSFCLLISTVLLASGCASVPVFVGPQAACSSLVPPSLRADVQHIELPGERATAGDVWIALDGEAGRLDTANTYKRAVLETVERCEARDAATAKHLTRKWFEFWK
jgi:hypothetical protein